MLSSYAVPYLSCQRGGRESKGLRSGTKERIFHLVTGKKNNQERHRVRCSGCRVFAKDSPQTGKAKITQRTTQQAGTPTQAAYLGKPSLPACHVFHRSDVHKLVASQPQLTRGRFSMSGADFRTLLAGQTLRRHKCNKSPNNHHSKNPKPHPVATHPRSHKRIPPRPRSPA